MIARFIAFTACLLLNYRAFSLMPNNIIVYESHLILRKLAPRLLVKNHLDEMHLVDTHISTYIFIPIKCWPNNLAIALSNEHSVNQMYIVKMCHPNF